eukprot:2569070-Alexandrium_andersonii.AAC.1
MEGSKTRTLLCKYCKWTSQATGTARAFQHAIFPVALHKRAEAEEHLRTCELRMTSERAEWLKRIKDQGSRVHPCVRPLPSEAIERLAAEGETTARQ